MKIRMSKKYTKRSIRMFYCLLLVPAVLWGILSIFGATRVLDYDTGEKRNKHEIAEGTTLGNLTKEAELYYNDRVPFRSIMLTVNSKLNSVLELPYAKGIQPGLIAMANASMKKENGQNSGSEEMTADAAKAGDRAAAQGANGFPDRQAEQDANGSSNQETEQGTNGSSGQGAAAQETNGASAQGTPQDTSGSADQENAEQGTNGSSDQDAAVQETSADAEQTSNQDGSSSSSEQQEFFPYIELSPGVIQGRDGWLFMTDEIPDYQGQNVPSQEQCAAITGSMETLQSICESKGKELYYVAIPNKSTVYSEYMPSIEKTDSHAVQVLEDYVKNSSSVRFEYIDQEMIDAKQYGKLYYFNDSHWNGRGALSANAILHRIMGLDEIDIGSLEYEDGDSFRGDLIDLTGMPEENFASETSVDYYYKTDVEISMIRGGSDDIEEFASTAPDGRTLVLVGDSYRHHLAPYLAKDFAHTYFINNYILSADCLDILESADIILVEDVERTYFSYSRAMDAISNLIAIMG